MAPDVYKRQTLHSAKGLEFPRVFMVGVEEGVFPSFRSFEEPGRLEEERRLAYVGITRAKQKLTICYAESRRVYTKEERHLPSRFITELPPECIQEIRLRGTVTLSLIHIFQGRRYLRFRNHVILSQQHVVLRRVSSLL